MPVLFLNILKLVFLALLYLFLWQVARAIGAHIGTGAGLRRPKDGAEVVMVRSEAQAGLRFAVEDPDNFGFPLLDALNPDFSSSDLDEVSNLLPVRYVDNTGSPTPAIPDIPGYDPGSDGNDVVFDIVDAVTGKDYKFARLCITFQLDNEQTSADPLPFVDRVALNFQFNF